MCRISEDLPRAVIKANDAAAEAEIALAMYAQPLDHSEAVTAYIEGNIDRGKLGQTTQHDERMQGLGLSLVAEFQAAVGHKPKDATTRQIENEAALRKLERIAEVRKIITQFAASIVARNCTQGPDASIVRTEEEERKLDEMLALPIDEGLDLLEYSAKNCSQTDILKKYLEAHAHDMLNLDDPK